VGGDLHADGPIGQGLLDDRMTRATGFELGFLDGIRLNEAMKF
jgi:hypothetical protein